jgi:hypothetical protein
MVADDAIGVAELSASGTASSSTFLRGDNAWAAAGGGLVKQFISKIDQAGQTSTSSTLDVLSQVFTPTNSSNKVLIWGHLSHGWQSDIYYGFDILRDDSILTSARGTSGSSNQTNFHVRQGSASSGSIHWAQTTPFHFYDSPGTASQVTYEIRITQAYGSGTIWYNRQNNSNNDGAHGGASSVLNLMEIEV